MPYKIDTGSNGNIMSEHMFKKMFPKVTNEQLAAIKNKHILLKTYNKTTITQLGMCMVLVEHKNNKKKCKFFVVSGNGQAFLGMPDTDTLYIIKINIHSIGAEDVRDSDWCANMHTAQGSNHGQETGTAEKCCTNKDNISNSKNNNTKPMVEAKANRSTEYFLAGPTYDSDKRKSVESTQQIHKDFDDVFNGIGYFEGTLSL